MKRVKSKYSVITQEQSLITFETDDSERLKVNVRTYNNTTASDLTKLPEICFEPCSGPCRRSALFSILRDYIVDLVGERRCDTSIVVTVIINSVLCSSVSCE